MASTRSDGGDPPRVYVEMADVTSAERNKLLVRERIDRSYNAKVTDGEIASLFSPDLTFNPAGTQLPSSREGGRLGGVARYLDRRALLLRALPDMRVILLEQRCNDSQVKSTSQAACFIPEPCWPGW